MTGTTWTSYLSCGKLTISNSTHKILLLLHTTGGVFIIRNLHTVSNNIKNVRRSRKRRTFHKNAVMKSNSTHRISLLLHTTGLSSGLEVIHRLHNLYNLYSVGYHVKNVIKTLIRHR